MNVEINRCNGEAFELPHLNCWVCDKPATVVELPLNILPGRSETLARICGSCLEAARQALSEAVLKGSICGT